jgi:hypothetical protein
MDATPSEKGASPDKIEESVPLMESKWPFMMIVLGLLFGLGYTISTMEKTAVMSNWKDRQCELPVMVGASFFKPESDSRTSSEFAIQNFEFCIKTFVDTFVEWMMMPIQTIFGKHVDAAGQAMNGLDAIRKMTERMYREFVSYLEIYFSKFTSSVFEMNRIVQHIKMAMQRINAIAMSFIFSGISFFRAMINAVQLVIKVVLIICGIMVAIIILLWFILFPVIPIILAALGMIIYSIYPFRGILSPGLQSDAEDKKGVFCFAEGALVSILDEQGQPSTCPVEKIKMGQMLGEGTGRITAIVEMRGDDVPLYSIEGILVSGSHLVKGTDGYWKSVAMDERAVRTTHASPIIYCFNTTSNCVPLLTTNQTPILFRDWEEIGNEDDKGQFMWNYLVSKILNKEANYPLWKEDVRLHCETPLMGKNVLVKTNRGWLSISAISWDTILVDRNGKGQHVLGKIVGEVDDATESDGSWCTEQYEERNSIWRKSNSTVKAGMDIIRGWNLMTETGEMVIWDKKRETEVIIRDFTEVGCDNINKTYEFVDARLRMVE